MINFTQMINILVVTADIIYGEQLRQNLEELGRFRACVVRGNGSAVAFVKEVNCPLVFLDTCLPEIDLLDISTQMRLANPGIRFGVISEPAWQLALEELSPVGRLTKPFNLPELQEMMNRLFPVGRPAEHAPGSVDSGNDLPWLSDVTRAAQHLTRLTLETSAQAALITRDDQLWAYAGQLPQSATRELNDTVSRYWDRQKENDLVRFIHLASTGAEHMLYATRLTKYMVLALIFDAETPFGTIHTQANRLVHSLSTGPAEKQNDVTPGADDAPSASIPGASSSSAFPSQLRREPSQVNPANQATLPRLTPSSIDLEKPVEAPAVTLKGFIKSFVAPQAEAEETRPNPRNESARRIILEPASPAVYNLDYACLLIPRFPDHHLIGDLSDRLPEWMQETCIAFGWRLEYLAVRPEYLLWNVNVPPPTSPAYLMRILRQRISVKIFDDFPRIQKENPSGDFWAPGYLIMGGAQPAPVEVVKDFIAQTRQRQGITQQFR
jgi:CheY-like chemotaxis protein/REP element-mobilizing transposase RayT